MFRKELKYRILSIVFLLVSAGILLMVYSSFVPQKWYMYAEPLSLQKFAYIELKSAYEAGSMKVYQFIEPDVDSADIPFEQRRDYMTIGVVKISLNQEDKDKILSVLKQLNPEYAKHEKLSRVEIACSEEEAKNMVMQLEHSVGVPLDAFPDLAKDADHYFYIGNQYEAYLQERLDVCINPTVEEQLDLVEEGLAALLNTGWYTVFQWGIGPEYPMFFGYSKNVDFTEEQMRDIWGMLQNMVEKRQKTNSTEALRYYEQSLNQIDDMLGGDTIFARKYRYSVSSRKNTLEEEREEFEKILLKENYTNAYARYLCDYLGILAGILPILYAAFIFSKDRRNRVEEFIMVSPQGSGRIVGKRLLSVVVVFSVWFYFIAAAATIYFAYLAYRFGYVMDGLAFFKYVTIWVMPTLLFTVSLSVFLDLFFGSSMMVILVQILLFFVSIQELTGGYFLWKPILRYNVIGRYDFYQENKNAILANRSCIVAVSIVLFCASVVLYEYRRRGKESLLQQKGACLRRICQRFRPDRRHKKKGDLPAEVCKVHSWLYYQLKRSFSRNFLFALGFTCFVGILFQGFGRDLEQLKRIGENYLSLSSIFLFIPLCNIEKETNVYEVMCVQKKAYGSIYLLRAGTACLLQGVVLAVPLLFFMIRFGYGWGSWCLGIYASALFLGLLGLLVGEKTESRRMGIAAILGYYVLCVSLKEKMTYFSVCGYTYRIANSKYYLLAGCIVEGLLLTGLLLYRGYAKRRRI